MRPDHRADNAHRQYGSRLVTMRRRAEFQRLRGGVRWSGSGFLMEGKQRDPVSPVVGARFGFTITKKIGKAHERNRMRRRLSHGLRSVAVPEALASWDCVIVARRATLDLPFETLIADFRSALARLARAAQSPPRTASKPQRSRIAEP